MKLRIKENMLRFRLTQTETEQLISGKSISSTILFPNDKSLTYTLLPYTGENTTVECSDQTIKIRLGTLDCESLADPKTVGVQNMHQTKGEALSLLIEKDFTCLHPRAGEDQDTFPNPNKKEIA